MEFWEMNPIEQALEIAVGTNARVMALQEFVVEWAIYSKYPSGLTDEEVRAKQMYLADDIDKRVREWLPLVRRPFEPPTQAAAPEQTPIEDPQ